MLDSKTHISQAKHNEELLEYLDGLAYPDWRATCLFYAALHYVGAYFSSLKPPRRFIRHADRDRAIEDDPRIGNIWSEYRNLKDWSVNARYNGVKPSDSDFKEDMFKSLTLIKKEIKKYTSIT